eukprot:c23619_g1_i1.p1 GENE.c23619_g1_i1~~c23619_g1_i1.p1  ORF type:complete len:180 (-),score=50.61 c23619_g1_i1:192-731(-)
MANFKPPSTNSLIVDIASATKACDELRDFILALEETRATLVQEVAALTQEAKDLREEETTLKSELNQFHSWMEDASQASPEAQVFKSKVATAKLVESLKEAEVAQHQLELERDRRVALEHELERLRRMLDLLKQHVSQLKDTQENRKKEPLVKALGDVDDFLQKMEPTTTTAATSASNS